MRFRPAALSALLAALLLLAGAGHSQPAPNRPRTWTASWVWAPGPPSPRNSYVYFRKSFELESVPKEARLHVTADSRYQIFVNGKLVGRGPVRSDRRWLHYDTWDVPTQLRKGKNAIAVLVHHYGEWTFQYMKGRGGLLAELAGPGGRSIVRTDATWKARPSDAWEAGGPRMDIQLGFNERYDARRVPEGWDEAAFNDREWPAAVEIGKPGMEPWPNLVPRDIPPMLEELRAPAKVLEAAEVELPAPRSEKELREPAQVSQLMTAEKRRPLERAEVSHPERAIERGPTGTQIRTVAGSDASLLIDFGKEVTGFPRFRIRGAEGGEIVDMGYGEVLQDPGGGFVSPASEKLGRLNPERDGVHYADRYTCRAGEQTFETFDKRGFRYLQIDVRNAPAGIELDDVGIRFSTFPVKMRGTFQCSDERLNRIWEIGRYTCQLNMEDGYTDCPWRERGQWWGDARVEALINYYAFGDTTLIKKALRQNGQSQNEEGMTWGVYPTDWDGGRLPSFTLIWISTLWDTYRYTGDPELVKELFPKIRYALDHFFAPRLGPRGLLKDVPYWVFIDWAPVDEKGESGSLNAYYYDALRSAAKMARLLEDSSAAEYESRATSVKAAMNARLWDAAAHAYRDSIQPDGKLASKISQQTNSLCVLFDIAPAGEQGRILDAIYGPESKGKVVEAGSPYFSFYQLAALYHAGRSEQALAYTREHWGRMLDWGATTWWEMWTPGASFCHGWSGGPTYDLSARVLGVEPLKPGWKEISVRPQWSGLRFASGVVPLPKGEQVEVSWQYDSSGKNAAVRVKGPDDVPLEITLPGVGEVRVNKKKTLPSGVELLESRSGEARYRVEKGGAILLELRGS